MCTTLIAILALIVLFAFAGRMVGFIKMLYFLFSSIFIFALAFLLSPSVGKLLASSETIYGGIYDIVDKNINIEDEDLDKYQKLINNTEFGKIKDKLKDLDSSDLTEGLKKLEKDPQYSELLKGINIGELSELLEGLDSEELAKTLKEAGIEEDGESKDNKGEKITDDTDKSEIDLQNLDPSILEKLFFDDGDEEEEPMTIKEKITRIIINIISFIIVYALISIVISIIFKALNIVAKLPAINFANKTLGCLVGIAGAICLTLLFFAIVSLVPSTDLFDGIRADIADSSVLTYFYEHNFVKNILGHFLLKLV